MLQGDSLIKAKARYGRDESAGARGADRQTAARLVSGLVGDLPAQNERPEVALLHITAIESFVQLVRALNDPILVDQQKSWADATGAANAWLRAVDG
jgi:hypothetical protein